MNSTEQPVVPAARPTTMSREQVQAQIDDLEAELGILDRQVARMADGRGRSDRIRLMDEIRQRIGRLDALLR